MSTAEQPLIPGKSKKRGAQKQRKAAAAAKGDELDAELRRAEAVRFSKAALLAEMRGWEEEDTEGEAAAAAGLVSRHTLCTAMTVCVVDVCWVCASLPPLWWR